MKLGLVRLAQAAMMGQFDHGEADLLGEARLLDVRHHETKRLGDADRLGTIQHVQ